jgi:hypothetical protein
MQRGVRLESLIPTIARTFFRDSSIVNQATVTTVTTCFTLISCLDLFLDPEGGGDKFLRNVG